MTSNAEKSETQIRHDYMILRMLLIKTLLSDLATFNKNPKLKTKKAKGYEGNYTIYNEEYYKELLEDLKSDFFKNYCKTFDIAYDKFLIFAMTNTTKIYTENFDYLSLDNNKHMKLSEYLGAGINKGRNIPKHLRWLMRRQG